MWVGYVSTRAVADRQIQISTVSPEEADEGGTSDHIAPGTLTQDPNHRRPPTLHPKEMVSDTECSITPLSLVPISFTLPAEVTFCATRFGGRSATTRFGTGRFPHVSTNGTRRTREIRRRGAVQARPAFACLDEATEPQGAADPSALTAGL